MAMVQQYANHVINLTPHDVNIVGDDAETFPRSGKIARVAVSRTLYGKLGVIPVYTSEFGEIENLPPFVEGVALIVSRIVADAARRQFPGRNDIFFPDDPIRDDKGVIVGAKSLGRA